METYTKKSKNTHKKCIVSGCDNPAFIGKYRDSDLCGECYFMLSNGNITGNRSNYLSELRQELYCLYRSKLLAREKLHGHLGFNQKKVMADGYPVAYKILQNKLTDE